MTEYLQCRVTSDLVRASKLSYVVAVPSECSLLLLVRDHNFLTTLVLLKAWSRHDDFFFIVSSIQR